MKATGMVRKMDGLGRVVVPKEICRTLRIREGDPVEFFVDEEGLYIRKYDAEGDMEQLLDNFEKKLRADGFTPQAKLDAMLGKVREMKDILSDGKGC